MVYFISRGVGHEAAVRSSGSKPLGRLPSRDLYSVRGKVDTIRRVPGLWTESSR